VNVAIIPARGGSKRIPEKNIRTFRGLPVIEYSIGEAKKSGLFDDIIISTDSQRIAEIGVSLGASSPFLRPEALSSDYAGTTEVITHAVDWLRHAGRTPTHVCCIYATAPFIRSEDIVTAYRLFADNDVDYVMPVTLFPYPIQRALKLDNESRIAMFAPEYYETRSQDLELAWHDVGQFYWGTATAWLQGAPIFSPRTRAIALPQWRVHDIDTPEDWHRAELMHHALELHHSQ